MFSIQDDLPGYVIATDRYHYCMGLLQKKKKLCVFSFIAVNAKILSGGLQFSSIITINKNLASRIKFNQSSNQAA
jgi:hypothetical protein